MPRLVGASKTGLKKLKPYVPAGAAVANDTMSATSGTGGTIVTDVEIKKGQPCILFGFCNNSRQINSISDTVTGSWTQGQNTVVGEKKRWFDGAIRYIVAPATLDWVSIIAQADIPAGTSISPVWSATTNHMCALISLDQICGDRPWDVRSTSTAANTPTGTTNTGTAITIPIPKQSEPASQVLIAVGVQGGASDTLDPDDPTWVLVDSVSTTFGKLWVFSKIYDGGDTVAFTAGASRTWQAIAVSFKPKGRK